MPADDATFVRLMRAAQAGDTDAYGELLNAITPLLRRLVRRRRTFLGADEVEDLVQDILLSVHSVRATYDSARPFTPWLLAIARNRLADSARRYARTLSREVVVDDLDVTFAADEANSPGEGYEDYRDRQSLRRAIDMLPPGQREAIELLKLRELSLKEAAATSGTTVGALKVATHRAMTALRRTLLPKP